MVKVISLFLIVMIVLAMFGKLRMPRIGGRKAKPTKCPKCSRHIIGKGPCACQGNTKG